MHSRAQQLVGVAIALVLIATLTTFAQSQAGQRELRRLGIVSPPPALTELAFVNPARLPTTLHRVPRALAIRFTLTNLDTRVASYRWEIVVRGTRQRIVRSGAAAVAPGRTTTIVSKLKLGCAERTRVNVVLSTGESIGFWAGCVGRSAVPAARHRRSARRVRSSSAIGKASRSSARIGQASRPSPTEKEQDAR